VLESVVTDSSAHTTGKVLSIFGLREERLKMGLLDIVAEDVSSLVR